MSEFAVIVVSDLHAGEDNRHKELRTGATPSPLTSKHFGLTALSSAIAPLVDSVDPERRVLVCAGDLTNKCLSGELHCASAFLKGLAEKLAIPEAHRFLVPGNHDIDWSLTRLATESDDKWYSAQRQAKFLEVLTASGYSFPTNGNPLRMQLLGGAVDFFLLDSPFEDLSDRKPHHGNLGKAQIEMLGQLLNDSKPDSTRIVVLHHHITAFGRSESDPDFSLLSDSRELQMMLKKHFVNLVIHGHQHRAGFEQIEGLPRPIAVLGTGSTTVPHERLDQGIFNSFHVVTFDKIKGTDACGAIHTRHFTLADGWRKPHRDGISLPHSRPFGHVFTPAQVEEWAKRINDLCDKDESVKIDDFLAAQENGIYYQAEDMIEVLKRRIKIASAEEKYVFLINEEQNYWEMQLAQGGSKTMSSSLDRVISVPSAKNLSLLTMVESFVPTDLFWDLLESDGHHVVFGTRGSGKTMLLKMMSVEHLLRFAKHDERAMDALTVKNKFGLFLPLGIDWCVAYLDTPGMSDGLFTNGVNLVSCEVLLNSIETILRGHILPGDPNVLEKKICVELGQLWFSKFSQAPTFISLRIALVQQQGVLRGMWRGPVAPTRDEEVAAGFVFRGGSLFSPIAMAIRVANLCLGLPAGHCWLLCLDELENLSPEQARHVTTALRAAAQNIFLKITTQPYTLSDPNTNFSAEATHVDFRDYQVRRLQCEPRDPKYVQLATGIFKKRVNARITPVEAFGESSFADRANKVDPLFDGKSRKSSSERKRIPVMALRRLKKAAEGHTRSEAYSGWEAVLRISDGNPGVFVQILNAMNVGPETTSIPASAQHKALVALSSEWHQWSQALYKDGKTLHDLIARLGHQLEARLHAKLDSESDVQEETNRFKVDLQTVDGKWAEAFKVGARHALLVAESVGSSPRYPDGEGVWRLAYFLSPKFWLLPRRGRISRLFEKDQQLSLPGSGGDDQLPSLKIEDELGSKQAEAENDDSEVL